MGTGGELDDFRIAKTVMAKLSGVRGKGRPRLGWMDGVNVVLGSREMTVEAGDDTQKM